MGGQWADVAVRTLFGSLLVLSQAVLVNHLGVPFAAVTVFAGLGAYGGAVAMQMGPTAALPVGVLLLVIVVLFVRLAPFLPEDSYLLLSLAALAVTRALATTVPSLGGQLGLPVKSVMLSPQEPLRFLLVLLPVYAVCAGAILWFARSEAGLAADIARAARVDPVASSLVPVGQLRALAFTGVAVIAMAIGVLQGLYAGRVDPNVFGVDAAVLLLIVTLVAGRRPWRMLLASIAFFVFPDVVAALFGYQQTSIAHLRDMAWSFLVIVAAGRGLGFETRATPASSARS